MKQYGLIGKSLQHSFSKDYFDQKFKKIGVKGDYQNYECDSLEEIQSLLKSDIDGFNVTIPYKEEIMSLLHELDPVAREVGAVNTLKKTPTGWKGYNTDVYGFRQSIKPFLEGHHNKALVLGTGGASKAVIYVLRNLGIDIIQISRTSDKGDFTYNQINENMMRFCPLIINTTPVGMFPNTNEAPDLPYQYITEKHFLVDLIYNPAETVFLQKGKEKGALAMNGKSMLELQAEKSWEIWNS